MKVKMENGWLERRISLKNKHHLHMRPAQRIVETASRFSSKIKAVKDHMQLDCKSILDMIEFANYMVSTTAHADNEFSFVAHGDDALDALNALENLVNDRFGLE